MCYFSHAHYKLIVFMNTQQQQLLDERINKIDHLRSLANNRKEEYTFRIL